jgi:hypothetical protein
MQYKYINVEALNSVSIVDIEEELKVQEDYLKDKTPENCYKFHDYNDSLIEVRHYLKQRRAKEGGGSVKEKKDEGTSDPNADLAKAAEEAEINSGTTSIDASSSGAGEEGWWSWLKPDDFFKALDPSRPPITFQSILKFLVLINFVGGGFLAMYEVNVNELSAIDFQLVIISIFIGMYGYVIYKL